jgi:hypothetical protein
MSYVHDFQRLIGRLGKSIFGSDWKLLKGTGWEMAGLLPSLSRVLPSESPGLVFNIRATVSAADIEVVVWFGLGLNYHQSVHVQLNLFRCASQLI